MKTKIIAFGLAAILLLASRTASADLITGNPPGPPSVGLGAGPLDIIFTPSPSFPVPPATGSITATVVAPFSHGTLLFTTGFSAFTVGTFAIPMAWTNASGVSIPGYLFHLDSNLAGAFISGTVVGPISGGQGFTASAIGPMAQSVTFSGGSTPSGALPSDFSVTLTIPVGSGSPSSFSAHLHTIPEPTSLLVWLALGLCTTVAGRWRASP